MSRAGRVPSVVGWALVVVVGCRAESSPREREAVEAPPDAPAASVAPAPADEPVLADESQPHDGDGTMSDVVVPHDDPAYSKAPAPTDAAWDTAPRLAMARSPKACEARVLGKWVRVRCVDLSSEASYSESLSGDPSTVRFAHQDPKWTSDYSKRVRPASRSVVFPLSLGERRVVQFADLSGGWRFPWTASTGAVISAYWLDGESAPTVVID